jgi:PEGA domain
MKKNTSWLYPALLAVLFAFGGTALGQTPAASQEPAVTAPSQQTSSTIDQTTDKKDSGERSHKLHVRFGGVYVGAGYSYFSGPFGYRPFWSPFYSSFYGYGPYGWDPFFYGPAYYPYYGDYRFGPDKGEVKLTDAPKSAAVFIDDAYAGTVEHLKSMWLDPGAYNLKVSTPDHGDFQQRIYVLSGKSLKIDARLSHKPEEKR